VNRSNANGPDVHLEGPEADGPDPIGRDWLSCDWLRCDWPRSDCRDAKKPALQRGLVDFM